jgi:hypothetical protein
MDKKMDKKMDKARETSKAPAVTGLWLLVKVA